jgi:5'-deoxynucleotidase YfbR-like HD superfamily hydrolase
MTDDVIKYIIGQLRGACWEEEAAAVEALVDRAEELKSEVKQWHSEGMFWIEKWGAAEAKLAKAVEALREISAEASVTVHTWKNGINFKKMYEGWRKIAVQKIDVARAALAELEGK